MVVHCGGGKGRAGTVLACYLCKHGLKPLLTSASATAKQRQQHSQKQQGKQRQQLEQGIEQEKQGHGEGDMLPAALCFRAPEMTAESAVALLRHARPGSIETIQQQQFVGRYCKLLWKRHQQDLKEQEEEEETVQQQEQGGQQEGSTNRQQQQQEQQYLQEQQEQVQQQAEQGEEQEEDSVILELGGDMQAGAAQGEKEQELKQEMLQQQKWGREREGRKGQRQQQHKQEEGRNGQQQHQQQKQQEGKQEQNLPPPPPQPQRQVPKHLLPKLVFLVGLPGSGKSTFAAALTAAEGAGWVRVCQDEAGCRRAAEEQFQRALKGRLPVGGAEKVKRQGGCVRVLLDRCNFSADDRKEWLGMVGEGSGKREKGPVAVHFDFPVEVCRERVVNRRGHPTIPYGGGRSIVDSFGKKFEAPRVEEGFSRVIVVRSMEEVQELVLAWGGEPIVMPL